MSLRQEDKAVKCTIEESTIQPLVSAVTSSPPSPPTHLQPSKSLLYSRIFSRSRGITLILLWNIILGFIYGLLQCVAFVVALSNKKVEKQPFKHVVYIFLGIFGIMSVGQMILYPLSGLLADLKYGRYKTITFSQVQITLAFLLLSIAGVIILTSKTLESKYYIIVCASAILLLLGFSGFQSNAVQFGLDQLLEAPSKHLSLFLWWYVWTGNIGEMIARVIGSIGICKPHLVKYVGMLMIIFTALSSVLLLFGCCKHHWFYCESKTHNPYGLIYRVLKFVAKTKNPLQRSALTYCDDIIPSRMDFAKHKYGGPYTTEVVEDVKTFLRILLMLFLVSPVFYYSIPGLHAFPIYALHLGRNEPADLSLYCSSDWTILQSGNLAYMVSFIFIPLYIVFFQSCIQKWLSRILHRLILGIVILVLFMWIMTALYAAALGHASHHHLNASCLFTSEYRNIKNISQTLEFPTSSLILPNIFAGIGTPIINVAILEFISAQSPHTMKGLVLGVFYTIRGFFVLLGCLVVFPFTSRALDWSQTSLYLECGFLYYIINALLGVAFIVVAIAANRWYKYRQREDKPYDHTYVEDYYSRYASRRRDISPSDEEASSRYPTNSNSINYGSVRIT